jgi:hypothetical protein
VSTEVQRAFLAKLGRIDLADYLYCDKSSFIGRSYFLKLFHNTSTLQSSQWLDYSSVEGASPLG